MKHQYSYHSKSLRQEFLKKYGKLPTFNELEQYVKNRKKIHWSGKKDESRQNEDYLSTFRA